MMASNILSRLLPSTSDEGQQPPDRHRTPSDLEHHADMAVDEENLGERFQDQDLEQLLAEAAGSEMTTESTAFLQQDKTRRKLARKGSSPAGPKWMKQSPATAAPIEEDDDVPESLLLEGGNDGKTSTRDPRRKRMPPRPFEMPPPVPGPSNQTTRAQWETTRAQQRLHRDAVPPGPQRPVARRSGPIPDPKERAMWRWANVENLDRFLRDVYDYYEQHGIWSISLFRVLKLL
jgi:autophagy-related protein 9